MFNEGMEKANLICGHYSFDKDYPHPFVEGLSDYIFIRGNSLASEDITKTIRSISSEIKSLRPGSEALISKLAEVLFIQIIRTFINSKNEGPDYFIALNDENISKVLNALHGKIEHEWGLEELAKISGLSRTGFINKFNELVGNTPIQYLTKIRMLKAKDLLENTSLGLFEISSKVGYSSEASFSRAFKKEFSQNPGQVRIS